MSAVSTTYSKLLCIASFAILAAYGQPRFEVASVKPGPPDGIGSMNGGPLPTGPFNQTNHDPGRITWTNVRLGRVIQVAFDLPSDRISGPDWLRDDVVTIVATVPEGLVGSPVEDRTGLTGIYDVHLEYVPDSPNATAAAAEPGVIIFDAVPSQLGLKLMPAKVPVETLVIDHVERVPTGD